MSDLRHIEHNGIVWTSRGLGPAGYPIWPIEEMIARCPFLVPLEIKALKYLYPEGKEEGAAIYVDGEYAWPEGMPH